MMANIVGEQLCGLYALHEDMDTIDSMREEARTTAEHTEMMTARYGALPEVGDYYVPAVTPVTVTESAVAGGGLAARVRTMLERRRPVPAMYVPRSM